MTDTYRNVYMVYIVARSHRATSQILTRLKFDSFPLVNSIENKCIIEKQY